MKKSKTGLPFIIIINLLLLVLPLKTYGISESYKNIIIALPVISIGKEAPLRFEYNLRGKGGIALEWFNWGTDTPQQELLYSEQEVFPKDSLTSRGKMLTFMLGRYSHGPDMSGFHWGLGLGYKKVSLHWRKSPSFIPFNQIVNLNEIEQENKDIQVDHLAFVEGVHSKSRLGYRFVSDDLGLVSGLYLALNYFSPQVKDLSETYPMAEKLTHSDILYLKRNLKFRLHIGMEFGWAF